MRPKFVLALLVSALLVIGLAMVLRPHRENATPSPVEAVSAPAPAVVPQPASPMPPPLPLPAPVAAKPVPLTPEEQQAATQAEIDRLQQWEMNDDPQSLSNILADLTSPDKAIREAAIEATKQFGSTNAIPALKAAAISSTDAQEQVEMLEAANFLTLTPASDPSLLVPKTPQEAQSAEQQRARALAHQQERAQMQAQQQAQQQNAAPAPSQPAGN